MEDAGSNDRANKKPPAAEEKSTTQFHVDGIALTKIACGVRPRSTPAGQQLKRDQCWMHCIRYEAFHVEVEPAAVSLGNQRRLTTLQAEIGLIGLLR